MYIPYLPCCYGVVRRCRLSSCSWRSLWAVHLLSIVNFFPFEQIQLWIKMSKPYLSFAELLSGNYISYFLNFSQIIFSHNCFLNVFIDQTIISVHLFNIRCIRKSLYNSWKFYKQIKRKSMSYWRKYIDSMDWFRYHLNYKIDSFKKYIYLATHTKFRPLPNFGDPPFCACTHGIRVTSHWSTEADSRSW